MLSSNEASSGIAWIFAHTGTEKKTLAKDHNRCRVAACALMWVWRGGGGVGEMRRSKSQA